jgi:polyhydroxyalkanoate synthase
MLFASLDPQTSAEKFTRFASMDQTSAQAQLFVAVEDWLNDGIDLPGEVAEECMRGWFFDNKPAKGAWMLGGKIIQADTIDCPCLIIASSKDRLVEYESAAALKDYIKDSTLIDPECGHIGMIAGDKAIIRVWHKVANWLRR